MLNSLDRHIHIIGEISDESYGRFARKLLRLEDESNEPIIIELMSEGGSATAALAYFDRIKGSPNQIGIVATGLVASAATLILAAGDNRQMTENAWLMVHEDSASNEEMMTVTQLQKQSAHLRRLEDQWNKLLASVTKTPDYIWASYNLQDNHFTPEECLQLGIIDEIFKIEEKK